MGKVQVRNKDHREYVEVFRDREIRIPPGGYVEMGRAEAVTFLGNAIPVDLDGQGRAKHPKNLEIWQDPETHAADRDQPFNPAFTAPGGKQFRTKAGYEMYMERMELEAKDESDKPKRRKRADA